MLELHQNLCRGFFNCDFCLLASRKTTMGGFIDKIKSTKDQKRLTATVLTISSPLASTGWRGCVALAVMKGQNMKNNRSSGIGRNHEIPLGGLKYEYVCDAVKWNILDTPEWMTTMIASNRQHERSCVSHTQTSSAHRFCSHLSWRSSSSADGALLSLSLFQPLTVRR